MKYLIHSDNNSVEISDKISFEDHKEFRNIVDFIITSKSANISIDISGVTFIDSMGLGMFLIMRDEAKNLDKQITLVKPQGQIKKMFDISRFNDLFNIEY
jgi:anti-anti-sigma factor